MQLIVNPQGQVHAIYTEAIDLAALGALSIRRASHVEPNAEGQWIVDLSPVGGGKLGPFGRRSEALNAEHVWLEQHWLGTPVSHEPR
jgi:hypothetical protein